MSGLFFVIEGCDNVGKTTQIDLLKELVYQNTTSLYENDVKFDVNNLHFIQFPDRTTESGQVIDRYLKGDLTLDRQRIIELFSKNRHECSKRIQELKESGKIVICDRYLYSGIAYAIAGDIRDKKADDISISRDKYISLEKGLCIPDDVFLLDGDPKVSNKTIPMGIVDAIKSMKYDDEYEDMAIKLLKLFISQESYIECMIVDSDYDGDMVSIICVHDNYIVRLKFSGFIQITLTSTELNYTPLTISETELYRSTSTSTSEGEEDMIDYVMNAVKTHFACLVYNKDILNIKHEECFDKQEFQMQVRKEFHRMIYNKNYWRGASTHLGPLGKWVIIDANKSISQIHESIVERIEWYFGKEST